MMCSRVRRFREAWPLSLLKSASKVSPRGEISKDASRARRSLKRLVLLPQHRRRDLELQYLIGPLVNPADARVLEMPAGPVQVRPAPAAEDLHRAVGRL